ncbi:hypothetical protein OBBRIDRAFT_808100 [Obba rivulosa]|uniref:Zn(2)-C6 fungal-type domain-containing protein n=1 Tax=Obba rivulosa TaxID=1052685 RepID=A0A8E2DJD0_9APHY|nr:hypothetical protein OBBRIDRAFT_808100 [Obba rivulosa]
MLDLQQHIQSATNPLLPFTNAAAMNNNSGSASMDVNGPHVDPASMVDTSMSNRSSTGNGGLHGANDLLSASDVNEAGPSTRVAKGTAVQRAREPRDYISEAVPQGEACNACYDKKRKCKRPRLGQPCLYCIRNKITCTKRYNIVGEVESPKASVTRTVR